jgi:hypothetical protein
VENPWLNIPASDYESHMGSPNVSEEDASEYPAEDGTDIPIMEGTK